MASTTLRMLIVGEDKASRAFNSVGRSASEASGHVGGFGKVAKGVFAGMAGWFAVSKITEGVKGLVDVGSQYTQELARIQALSGANNATMAATAHQLEASSGLYAKYGSTVSDAASGVVALVKAGQTLPHALKEVNSTLVLAKSGMLSVGDASEVVSNTLNTFHLRAKDAGDIANKFANAADASAADVSTLAEALKYVGPVAHASNVPLDQTLGILAELSNAGIDASNSGTGFRKFLSSLQAPTGAAGRVLTQLGVNMYTATGKAKPLAQMIGELKKAMSGLTDEQKKEDLRAIFGLTGIASANVILDHGVKGLKEYTKATDRAGGAARLAKANSAGLSGALLEIRSQAISTAQAFYRKYSPVVATALRNAFAWVQTNGPKVLAWAKSWAKNAFSTWGPALKNVEKLVIDTFKSFQGSGGEGVLKTFGNAIRETGKVIGDLAKALDSIPAPIKKLGVEAVVAAVAFSKLQKIITGFKTSTLVTGLTTLRSDLALTRSAVGQMGPVTQQVAQAQQRMATRMQAARQAAKNLAGAGGMLALVDGMQRVQKSGGDLAGTLETGLGGALTGFAAGGPIGAAIGGGAGLLFALKKANDEANASFGDSSKVFDDYRASLNQLNGAVQRQTLQTIRNNLQKNAASAGTSLDVMAKLYNVPTRDQIQAIAGNVDAFARIKDRLNKQVASGKMDRAFASDFLNFIRQQRGQIEREGKSIRQNTSDLSSWGKVLKGIPKQAVTKLKQEGYDPSVRQLRDLQRQYKLTPKQLAIIIKQTGAAATVAQIMGELRPLPGQASRIGNQGGHALSAAFAAAASSGNPSAIGSALAAGVAAGIHSSAFLVTRQAVAMVASAEQAARARGIIKSPSRLMRDRVGKPLAEGVAVGIRQASGGAIKEAARLVRHVGDAGEMLMDRLIKGIQSKELPLKSVLARLTTYISNQQQKLANDISSRNQFAQGFSGFSSSLFGADYGSDANGNPLAPSVSGILSFQQKQAASARSLNRNVRKLISMGLSKSLIQQMQAAGPSGLAEINALASGASASQIKALNQANAATYRNDHAAGMAAGNAIYGAKIAQDRHDLHLAKAIARELTAEQRRVGKDEYAVVTMNGEVVITAIRKEQRKKGKKPTV